MLRGRSSHWFVCLVACLSIGVSALVAQQPATKKAPGKKTTTKKSTTKTAPATKKAAPTKSGATKKKAATTGAPKYKWYSPSAYKDEAAKKALLKQVNPILTGRRPLDGGAQAELDKWFLSGKLLEFTSVGNVSKLPELRADLLKSLRTAKRAPADYAKPKILSRLLQYAQMSTLHPAVRYNAMLTIGQLNDIEHNSRDAEGRRAPYPDPMDDALNPMVREFLSTKQIDAVRIAAQIGLLRHAKLNHARPANRRIDAARRDGIVGYMLKVVQSTAPAGRSPEGHVWMQRRAIEIMAAFDAVGRMPTVTTTLENIVADEAAATSLRCTAAEALARWLPNSKLKYNAGTPSNLGRIGAQAFKSELELVMKIRERDALRAQVRALLSDTSGGATESGSVGGMSSMMGEGGAGGGDTGGGGDFSKFFEQSKMAGGGAGYGGGGEGTEAGDEEVVLGPLDPRVTRSCRRLKYQLACIRAGLEGMGKIEALKDKKAPIDTVVAAIDKAFAETKPVGDLSDLEKSIKAGMVALNDYLPADEILEDPLDSSAPGEPGSSASPPEPGTPAATPPEPGAPAGTAPAVPGEPGAPPAQPGEPGAPGEPAA